MTDKHKPGPWIWDDDDQENRGTSMDIVIDYDNDCLRLEGGPVAVRTKADVWMGPVYRAEEVQAFLSELLNAINPKMRDGLRLTRQDEGTLTVLEEW